MNKEKIKQNINEKKFPLIYFIIALSVFISVFMIVSITTTMNYYKIIKEISKYKKEIISLEKEKKLLISEREIYKSPKRILEVGLQSGTLHPRKENDIIYIKIEE